MERIHTYLISCTFWNAETLRALFLQLAQGLMLALGQSHSVTLLQQHFKACCTHRHCSCLEYSFGSSGRLQVGFSEKSVF